MTAAFDRAAPDVPRYGGSVPLRLLFLDALDPPQIARVMVKRAARILSAKRPQLPMRIPPPRLWETILDDLPTDLGVELYILARQIWLWAECPPELRPKLFPPKTAQHVAQRRAEVLAEAPDAIREALGVLMRLGRERAPAALEVAKACAALVEWAQETGYSEIAVHFAEAGAAAAPDDSRAAFIAARTNRYMGAEWRAEVLYSRAIRLAYRSQDHDVYVKARLGYGRLVAELGRPRAAARHYSSAARVASDQGHAWLAAQTYHDLMVLSYEHRDFRAAARYARLALTTYPKHHERYPIAVHDTAVLLIAVGRNQDALKLLEPLSRISLRPHEQVLVAGTFARLAGVMGDRDLYGEAESRVLRLAPHYDLHAPFAYANLAYGARALGMADLATEYATRGLALAKSKGRDFDAKTCSALLKQIRSNRPASPPSVEDGGEAAEKLVELTGAVAHHVGGWRAETWTRKERQAASWTLGRV